MQEQQNEVSKATIGLGRWIISPCYAQITQKANSWFSMSLAEKQDTLSSLHKSSPLFSTSSSNTRSMGADTHKDSEDVLSVPYSSIKGLLSEGQVKSMWRKAGLLLNVKR